MPAYGKDTLKIFCNVDSIVNMEYKNVPIIVTQMTWEHPLGFGVILLTNTFGGNTT